MPCNLIGAAFVMLSFGLPAFAQTLESKPANAQKMASYISNTNELLPERIRVRDPATTGNTKVQSNLGHISGMSKHKPRRHDRLQRTRKTPSR